MIRRDENARRPKIGRQQRADDGVIGTDCRDLFGGELIPLDEGWCGQPERRHIEAAEILRSGETHDGRYMRVSVEVLSQGANRGDPVGL